ncbi:Acetyltransferase (GNAT) family protein [Candidatus Pantoea varia]|uniref:Acetyltransferase (GNAT) family protein n=1 Tax=Candidatus Pantoea varia TaxID=1881036 RepID=A0A1I5HRW0_9GAMM|nr:N-acetyltransferase [Pantoea varia]SFO51064.1 Acetyltransferase (GNAT) family protein [Pantoea varia]
MLDYMVSLYRTVPVSSDCLSDWIASWLAQQQTRCHDHHFSADFPWRETGLPQHTFLQRELTVNGQRYLTGPRYLGGDLSQPFIEIVARDGPIDYAVADAIMQAWQPLKPLQLRILLPASHPDIGSTDQLIFLSDPAALAVPHDEGISLVKAGRKDYSACIQAINHAYRASWHMLPHLRDQLMASSRQELREDIAGGHVLLIVWQGMVAGLMICVRRRLTFIEGFQIMDEVIMPAYQGRGLAARAQQRLLQQLHHHYGEKALLTGTILPGNTPSLRSAQNAGRRCVLKYQFFTPADLAPNLVIT